MRFAFCYGKLLATLKIVAGFVYAKECSGVQKAAIILNVALELDLANAKVCSIFGSFSMHTEIEKCNRDYRKVVCSAVNTFHFHIYVNLFRISLIAAR